MSLFAELKRRELFKVGAAYLVVAWVVIRAASIAFPTFDAPVWALRVFILVTLLGFPIALVLAWAIEIGPDGFRLEPAPIGNKRVASIAALLAALPIAWYFVGRPRAIDADARSVAVLPFVNMSADPILSDQGRYAEAAVSAERAVALHGNGFAYEALFYARLRTGANDAARAALAEACADYGSEEPQCLLVKAFALAAGGSKDEARALVERAAAQPSPLWSGNPPFSMAAAVYSAGLGDYASAATAVRSSFGAIAWAPTMPLLLEPGGARLPEEINQDRQWLDAWADPRARELMAAYRANITAFRKGE